MSRVPTAPSSRRRGVVIAWMPVSQRSTTIADRLGFDLVLVARSGFRRPWTAPLAYPISAARTIRAIVRLRPRAAIIAVPPFVAPLVAMPFLAALRAPFAIDVHSGAVLDRRWRWALGIIGAIGRRSVGAVVTIASLEGPLRERGVETMVIPDPLPRLAPVPDTPLSKAAGRPVVVAICGWGSDEPIEELVASATGRAWQLVLTGQPRRTFDPPPNVTLAGFLDHEDYVARLAAADAIVVLTERDDTLLSGAWEAIALGRPLVVSGTAALRSTFGEGVVYVGGDAESIGGGIDRVLADKRAPAAVAALRERFARDNDAVLGTLAARLERPRITSARGPQPR